MTKSKNVLLSACAALVVAATSVAMPTRAADMGTIADDSVLTSKVKAALIENPATKARQINVDTKSGVVQLNGFVDSDRERIAAERAAKAIVGVRSVDNNLQIAGPERTVGTVVDDSAITAKVKTALLSDSRTKGYEVNVKTNNGVVSLGGFVSTAAEREVAETLAGNVTGVAKVENGIMVEKR